MYIQIRTKYNTPPGPTTVLHFLNPKKGTFKQHLDVSKNRGTSKWMVKIMEIPFKIDDLGKKPPFKEPPHIYFTSTH